MFDEKDILARLLKGESEEKIAEEMAQALNSAKAQKESLEKEKIEKKAKKAKKKEIAQKLLQDCCDYLELVDAQSLLASMKSMKEEQLIEVLDDSIALANTDFDKIVDRLYSTFGF